MELQIDLLGQLKLDVKPEVGRNKPRLWVRRFIAWSEPGKPIREIELRPGLNIIWSPDPGDQGKRRKKTKSLGHGSGKTLFSRLIRYCLGENHLAQDGQRQRIAAAFSKGQVGVEVFLDGVPWSIIRPIGRGRGHYAVANVTLDQLVSGIADGSIEATGIEPFLAAVESNILTSDVVAMIPFGKPLSTWQAALAWLSRDQECRFDKIEDWRVKESDSASPVSGIGVEGIVEIIRVLIGAIEPEELQLSNEINHLESEREKKKRNVEVDHRLAERMRSHLLDELKSSPETLFPGRMAVEALRQMTRDNFSRVSNNGNSGDTSDLGSLRSDYENVQSSIINLEKNLSDANARIPEIRGMVAQVDSERSHLSVEADQAGNPFCAICEVPIDIVLLEGRKLSHKRPNFDEINARFQNLQARFRSESERLELFEGQRAQLLDDIGVARARKGTLHSTITNIEKTRDSNFDLWHKARRLIDEVEGLDEFYRHQEEATASIEGLNGEIEAKRKRVLEFRFGKAEIFARLTKFFDAIIQRVIGSEAKGSVYLDGRGIHPSVEMGGERTTAAIESLKVLAFDLAVLCMSIEGRTHLPAFLLHDSPREADLGISLYHELFSLIRELEGTETRPLFQYILTTTTSPPDDMGKKDSPWLRATLHGSPAEERLLRCDL